MVPAGSVTLAPLETLFETRRGMVLPLPPKLARLYGCLRMPLPRTHPHVFSNFVTTLGASLASAVDRGDRDAKQ